MKIKRFPLPNTTPITIRRFASSHDLTMEVHERTKNPVPGADRYYAHFEDSDVKEGRMLRGAFGNGSTEQDAIKDYAKQISGQILIIDAFSVLGRREIAVPLLKEAQ